MNLDNCKNYLQIQVDDDTHDMKIVETNDEQRFCGKDVCNILGYSDENKALRDNIEIGVGSFFSRNRVTDSWSNQLIFK